jgi:hypothetical protein
LPCASVECQRRAVMVAEEMSKRLKKAGYQVKAVHRDMPR